MSDTPAQMFPIFSVVSNNFEKDIDIVKGIFSGLEKMSHVENSFRLSERAEFAAGWWFYDVRLTEEFTRKLFQTLLGPDVKGVRNAKLQIIDVLQDQLSKRGSEAKIKMHGDMPFAAPWWAWLMS